MQDADKILLTFYDAKFLCNLIKILCAAVLNFSLWTVPITTHFFSVVCFATGS
jgi:hypothetical protein